jgi:tetratricopeptide (TPR) repeat protein
MMNNLKTISLAIVLMTGLAGCGSSADSAAGFIDSGKKLLAQDKPEKARLEFKNAIQVDPKVVESYYQLALLDEKAKSWKAMFANLSKVEQLDEKHHDAVIKLGQLYLLSGELDKALERANKVIK